MGKVIGIDLGTTNSVCAVVDSVQPRVLDSREGKPLIRSMVSLKKRKGKQGAGEFELLVGDVAEDNWEFAPKDTIFSIKRLMGRGVADPDVTKIQEDVKYKIKQPSDGTRDSVRAIIGGKEYSPIDISAMILQKIKEDAEMRLNDTVTHAVITVPAYFSQIQRNATRQAGLKAGLKIIKILDEPTAAAIAYGVQFQESTDPKYMLVYDLGGGTFDISVLMWAGNVFAPLNLQGDMWLGGDNFDKAIIEKALQYIRREYGINPENNERFMVALRRKARDVKERLSGSRTATLFLLGLLHDQDGELIDVDMEVTREEFEDWVRPLVNRTIKLTEKALEQAGVACEQIDHVLMAGNTTNIPLVQQAMEQMFGKDKVMRRMHPKLCVGLGAAIVATRIGEKVICQAPDPSDQQRECGHVNQSDAVVCEQCGHSLEREASEASECAPGLIIGDGIAPFQYGTQTAGDKFSVFIKKNEPYPTENPQTLPFYTSMPNQRIMCIPVYAGDHLEKASLNEKQGEAFAILPPHLPQGTPVRIKLWLNSDGIFKLEAYLEDGTDLRPWVLTGEADQKVVEALQELEKSLHQKVQSMSQAAIRELEQAREQVFDKLKENNNRGALEAVEKLGQMIGGSEPAPPQSDPRHLANILINYTQFLIANYGWALPAELTYRLTKMVEGVQQALKSSNEAILAQKVNELDQATNPDQLPEIVTILLGLRNAIINKIQAANPGEGAELMRELEQVIEAFKAEDPDAMKRLAALATRMNQIIGSLPPIPTGAKCWHCGEDPKGNRICPNCKTDLWLPTDKDSSASFGIFTSR